MNKEKFNKWFLLILALPMVLFAAYLFRDELPYFFAVALMLWADDVTKRGVA